MKTLGEPLDQSELQAGKLEISYTDFHLASLVRDTIQLFVSEIDEKGLELNVEIDVSLPESARGDPFRIRQILSNLIRNALEFTTTGGISVLVGFEPENLREQVLQFSVSDSGLGLSKEAQNNLFTPFTQADNSISRKFGGTGLGLSVSKQLAHLMGGDIGVNSAPGEGSTFWFTVKFQRARGKIERTDQRRSPKRWTVTRSLRVLVAEDTDVMQHIIYTIFSNLGHRVVIAENGAKAVDCVEKDDFDIILMDVRMPVVDGLQATAMIRAMDGDKGDIPIIALTADITAGNVRKYTNIGMNTVCSKPVELPALLKTINKLLGENIHSEDSAPSFAHPAHDKIERHGLAQTENTKIQDTGFQHVLIRVAKLADHEINGNKVAPTLQVDGVPVEKLMELTVNYEKRQIKRCAELKSAFDALAENPTDNALKGKVKWLTHAIKGAGGTYGYDLTTAIATEADEMLAKINTLEDTHIRILGNQIDALSLIAHKRISGHGGKAGQSLLQGLKAFSNTR